MFWRKTRAAIGRFHELHQGLVWQRTLTAKLQPSEWAAVLESLAGHDAVVKRRKWALPERVRTVLVPLIRVLGEDMAPDRTLAIAADLRGSGAPDKAGPRQSLQVRKPYKSVTEWYETDPWLRVQAELRDGSVLDLQVVDRIRNRKIVKVNPRGKHKHKKKTKGIQRIRAARRLPKGRTVTQPDSPPPPWIDMKIKDDKRVVLYATAKVAPIAPGEMQTHQILLVATELFRWTPPDSGRPARRPA